MRKYMILGLITASISSLVICVYLYSIFSFIPKGSPEPLLGEGSPIRKELTYFKLISIYVFLSLIFSLIFGFLNNYIGKWGVVVLNIVISSGALLGFYYVLTFQRDGWDEFQLIGTPLFYIWPLVWFVCQPLILFNSKNNEQKND